MRCLLAVAAVSSSVACGPGTMGDPDAGGMEAGTMMEGGTQPDGGRGGICADGSVIDLNMRGTRMGAVTRFTGNNSMAAGTQTITPPGGCVADGARVIRQVAHSYRVQAAGILRVSTANPGTPTGMTGNDTVLWVQQVCDTRAMSLGCNDDASQTTSSTLATTPVTAGQMVTIVVASYAQRDNGVPGGAYELSVEEVQPVATGGMCDPAGPNVCMMGNTCLRQGSTTMGRCTLNGTAPLTPCRASGTRCDSPLICREVQMGVEVCVNVSTVGGRCDVTTACPTNSECIVLDPDDNTHGTCLENGSVPRAACRPAAMSPRCAMGLECVMVSEGVERCLRPAMLNAPCSTQESNCPMNSACIPTSPFDQFNGTCIANQTVGGLCNMMNACMMGTCSSTSATGTCRTTAMSGAACDPTGFRDTCAMGSNCVPNAMGTAGMCVPDGTAAGAACRTTGTQCDMGLQCSSAMGAGTCQTALMAGGMCTSLLNTTVCPTGEVCRATSATTGTCGGAEPEASGDNDTVMTAGMPRMTPFAMRGAIMPATDRDCVAVTVPMPRGHLYAATTDGNGGCPIGAPAMMGGAPQPIDTVLRVRDPMGNLLFTADDRSRSTCSTINGMLAGSPGNNLAGGTYYVCVESYQNRTAIPSYVLNVHAVPAM